MTQIPGAVLLICKASNSNIAREDGNGLLECRKTERTERVRYCGSLKLHESNLSFLGLQLMGLLPFGAFPSGCHQMCCSYRPQLLQTSIGAAAATFDVQPVECNNCSGHEQYSINASGHLDILRVFRLAAWQGSYELN